MTPILKILLFPLLTAVVVRIGYSVYLYFNEKIIGSRTLPSLLLFTALLIIVNTSLFLGGLLGLLKLYELLS